MAQLEVRLLGRFAVTRDGSEVAELRSETAKALLALLAAQPGRVWSRATVAELLWPDRRPGGALGNLRHTLSGLRRALSGGTALVADRTTISLAPGEDTWVDLVEFEELVGTSPDAPEALAAWERGTELWRGDFLEDVQPAASAEWEDWKLTTAEHCRRNLVVALRSIADWHEQAGNVDAVIDAARRLIDVDPWEERSHRQLMQALASRGEHATALAHYEEVAQRFQNEYRTRPSQQTVTLAEQIRRGRTGGTKASVGIPSEWLSDIPADATSSTCVGRERELEALHSHLELARRGRGRFVLISGEAGSGKTTLMTAFARRATEVRTVVGRCNAFGGLGDPYLPLREALSQLAGDVEAGLKGGALTVDQATRLWERVPEVAKLIAERAPNLPGALIDGAGLVHRAARAAPDAGWLDGLRTRVEAMRSGSGDTPLQPALFDEYTAVLARAADASPLVLVIDDLQWADDGSIALLWHLVRRLDQLRVLIVAAYRSEEVSGGNEPPALSSILRELSVQADLRIELAMDRGFVDAIVDAEPNELGEDFRRRLFSSTGGNALFTVEMLKGMRERGEITRDTCGAWIQQESLDWEAMPRRVEAAIERRIARLPDDVVADLTAASVQGDDFVAEVAAAVRTDADTSQRLHDHARATGRVTEAVGVERIDHRLATRHRFRHMLFRQYFYDTLDDAEHIRLHEATARAMESLYAGHANPPVTDLAYHFDKARLVEPSIEYFERAARRALGMAAQEEAIRLLERAHELVNSLPASTQRTEREVELLVLLAAPINTARGWGTPEARRISDRIRDLIDHVEPSIATALALIRLAGTYIIAGRSHEAIPWTQKSLAMAETLDNATLLAAARFEAGVSLTEAGQYEAGHRLLRAAYESEHDWDLSVIDSYGAYPVSQALAYDASNTRARGFFDQARSLTQRAVVAARKHDHPYTQSMALVNAYDMHHAHGDDRAALDALVELEQIVASHRVAFYAAKTLALRGSLVARQGEIAVGIDLIEQALAQIRAIGVIAWNSEDVIELAELEYRRGDMHRALQVLCDGEREINPEGAPLGTMLIALQRGSLLRREGNEAAAHEALTGVLASADAIGERPGALRAATELALLYEAQGKKTKAREVLQPRYDGFTEGFATPLLMNAREVLDRL